MRTIWNKGLTQQDDQRIKRIGQINSTKMKALWQNEDYRQKQLPKIGLQKPRTAPWNKGVPMWSNNNHHWARQNQREMVSQKISRSKKGVPVPLYRRKLISETITRLHREGVYSGELKIKITQAMWHGLFNRPTKPEQKMLELLSELGLPFEYTGNGTTYIAKHFPDFINKQTRQIIEVFGKYWHSTEDATQKTSDFLQAGYTTLIVWDYELKKRNRNNLKKKVFAFANGGGELHVC